MNRSQHVVRILFALGIMSVGVMVLVYGYSILVFMPPPPAWVPVLRPVGVASGILMLGTGAGLLLQRTAGISTRILLPFLLLWTLTQAAGGGRGSAQGDHLVCRG